MSRSDELVATLEVRTVMEVSRREFVPPRRRAPARRGTRPQTLGQAPAVVRSGGVKPGRHRLGQRPQYKNGGTQTCVETAFAMMTEGEDVLDALIAGVNIVELDPEDTSVGYGGLPNAEGVVQLDASLHARPAQARRRRRRASKACARRRWSRRR